MLADGGRGAGDEVKWRPFVGAVVVVVVVFEIEPVFELELGPLFALAFSFAFESELLAGCLVLFATTADAAAAAEAPASSFIGDG